MNLTPAPPPVLGDREKLIVAAGDKMGQLGLWEVGGGASPSGVFNYTLHTKPVAGLVCSPHDCTKVGGGQLPGGPLSILMNGLLLLRPDFQLFVRRECAHDGRECGQLPGKCKECGQYVQYVLSL